MNGVSRSGCGGVMGSSIGSGECFRIPNIIPKMLGENL